MLASLASAAAGGGVISDDVKPIVQSLATTVIHILDISLEGTCLSQPGPAGSLLGCHVHYQLPPLHLLEGSSVAGNIGIEEYKDNFSSASSWSQAEVVEVGGGSSVDYSLWWDGECSILNSRLRHKFSLESPDPKLLAGEAAKTLVSPTVLTLTPFSATGISFRIVPCDADGSPIVSSSTSSLASAAGLGASAVEWSAFLPGVQIDQLLRRPGGSCVVELPIVFSLEALEAVGRGLDSNSAAAVASRTLKLSLSHRIEPILIRNKASLNVDIVEQSNLRQLSAAILSQDASVPKDQTTGGGGGAITRGDELALVAKDNNSVNPMSEALKSTALFPRMQSTIVGGIPLLVSVEEVAHLSETLMKAGEDEDVRLLCACVPFNPGSGAIVSFFTHATPYCFL